MPRLHWSLIAAVPLLLVPAPVPARGVLPGAHAGAPAVRHSQIRGHRHTVGLGNVLTTKNGGQIFGFDIDQNGNDGVLAAGGNGLQVETFDQDTGKIGKALGRLTQTTSYSVDGIFAGDVALVTRYVEPKGQLGAVRHYEAMNPVTTGKFTHTWIPPIKDLSVLETAENQTTSTGVLFAIELKNQDKPDLVVSNVTANTFKIFHLDPNLFGLADSPQLGQYTAANQAVVALSPDAGRVGGEAPINVLIDLATGKQQQFTGYNGGTYGAGSVNGAAVDPNTGVEATTTELNAQVEFYDLNKQTGIAAVQLPCTGPQSQENSGAGIAVDPVNKVFLVTETYSACGSGSALFVYDEAGNLIETITGFNFFLGEPAPAINPSKRMGWAFGPSFSKLQQFFY
jgi:hypothetical protein